MAPDQMGISSSMGLAEISTEASPSPSTGIKRKSIPRVQEGQYKWEIVWRNVIIFIVFHMCFLYGFYLWLFVCTWKTILWTTFLIVVTGFGITAGAHRLWAHRAYKARLPLRIMLMIFQTVAFQNHVYEWARDHRVHHKFTDTDADPHNATRGFFFSHIGWLLVKKHKDVKEIGKNVDLRDLESDEVVMFQKRYYAVMMPLFAFIIPIFVPWYFFNESWLVSICVSGIGRYTYSVNATWLVNSAAHIWGTKPYDKNISPTENRAVAFLAFGEGWHNYHHVFPWDYKAAELGNYRLNFTTAFLQLMAKIGWAYDLKTASVDMVMKRKQRTGQEGGKVDLGDLWGWGDEDMCQEEIADVKKFNKIK